METQDKLQDKLKVAVIGLGKMGIIHTALVNMIPESRLAAVADINKQLATYVRQAGLKAPFYSDVDKMLTEVKPDAALICTPAAANLPVAEQCLKYGLHVFAEKPLAHTLEAARRMVALAAEKKVVNATGYLLSQMALCKKAKALLADGVVGRPFRYRSSFYTTEVFSRKKGWYYDKAQSGGGVVINVGSHLLYLLYAYFGLPASVVARIGFPYSLVEDTATALFEYPDGMTGTFDVSWSLPGYRLPYMELIVEGDNGTLELNNDYVKLYLYKAAKGYPKDFTTIHKIDMPSTSRFELGAEGLYEEDQDFVRACRAGTAPAVTWADGFAVQRMIEAIYRSAERKAAVTLDEVK